MKKVLAIFLSFAICLGQIPVNSVKAEISTNETRSSNVVTVRFDYTGNVQEFTAPRDGEYTLTVAGAQGGTNKYTDRGGETTIGVGGKGGTSTGKVDLKKGQTIFIVVGDSGRSFSSDYYYSYSTSNDTGYNGGIRSSICGGGGATHIALTNRGELKNYESYNKEILIVAGGGGGGLANTEYGIDSTGGAGGGEKGGGEVFTINGNSFLYDLGATQSHGGGQIMYRAEGGYVETLPSENKGSFGEGCRGFYTDVSGGPGGGWYGGGSYAKYPGGGGSGYIGGVTDGFMTTGANEGDGWATVSYVDLTTITYDANGGVSATDGTSTSVSDEVEPDSEYTVKSGDMFKRVGYTFEGWNEVTDGTGTSWKEGDTFSASDDKTLYALWSLITYNISYELNGGSITGEKTDYTVETDTFTLPTPTREGYTFIGWTGSNGSTPETSVSVTKGSTGNRSYTANWTPINYSISYDLDGGSISGEVTEYNIETDTFVLPMPTKPGYNFIGWTGSNGTTPETSVSVTKGSTGHRNYTANWELINYNITYDLNGGSVSGEKKSYTVETETFSLPTPTREGYIFTGWTGTNGNTPEITVSIGKGSTGDRSYTANWRAITYTVKYSANGGTGTMEDSLHVYDNSLNSRENTFTKEGYRFDGWYASRVNENKTEWLYTNGSKKAWYTEDSQPEGYHKYKYSNGEAPFNITIKENDVITFNAQWLYDTVKVAVPQSLIGDKNGNSSFIVKSDIKSGNIVITAPDGFYYKQEGKDDVYARISSSDSLELSSQNKCISFSIESEGISAGSWSGTFNITLNQK